ncbi:MAG: hypothetical protein IPN74_16875, partial [Haliscomenobacter sp.]|nr:hypothetical protein [Haliscomenobacter sp.]
MNHISYEYGVAFILNNTLYTGECKVSSKKPYSYGKEIRDELFKYASVVVQFGLNAKAFFAIGNDLAPDNKELAERCKIVRLPYPADI